MGSKNRLFSRLIRQFNSDLTIKTESLETEAQVTTATVSTQVDSAVAALVEAAPAALDTLDELAAALGDDANFATTVTNSLATKANVSDVLDSDNISSIVEGYGYAVSANLATVATTGSYSDLDSTPTVPTDISDLQDVNDVLSSGGGVTLYDSAGALPITGLSGGEQALITSTGRLYIHNGSGWYNIALINNAPTINEPVVDGTGNPSPFRLASDGTTATVITIDAVDSDGTQLSYAATTGGDFDGMATISQSGNVFTITPKANGVATGYSGTITFTATDGINTATSSLQSFTLSFPATWTTISGPSRLRLWSNQGAYSYDRMGDSIIVSENYLFGGEPNYGEAGTGTSNKGGGKMWTKSGTNSWTFRQAIDPASTNNYKFGIGGTFGVTNDNFLYLVSQGNGSYNGAYCYQTTNGGVTWTRVSNGDITNIPGARDMVLMDDDLTAIISHPTGANVYTRASADPNVSSWTFQTTLAGNYGGNYTTIDGDPETGTIILGHPSYDAGGNNAGGMSIYQGSGASWTVQADRVHRSVANDNMGWSVSISGNIAVIGSVGTGNGRVYTYTRSGSTWSYRGLINGPTGGYFSSNALKIQNNTMFVGAPFYNSNTGQVMIYKTTNGGGSWSLSATYTPTASGAKLGSSIDVWDRTLAVGAPEQQGGTYAASGNLYLYYSTD